MGALQSVRWLWLALAVVAADQGTKSAIERFTAPGTVRVLIPGLLNLVHSRNPGVAFGLLADTPSKWVTSLLILFSLAAVVVLAWLLTTGRGGGRLNQAGLALILGGAAGNLIDRALHSSVIDFIDFHLRGRYWPAFNLADSAIVIGAGVVIAKLLFDPTHPANRMA